MRLTVEERRLQKLHALLSAQRDLKAGEATRLVQKEKDARQHVRMKELLILDLTKRCNEITNRLKEFSALYEIIKNERNKYVNLIQSSTQALAEMREKIRILNNEVQCEDLGLGLFSTGFVYSIMRPTHDDNTCEIA